MAISMHIIEQQLVLDYEQPRKQSVSALRICLGGMGFALALLIGLAVITPKFNSDRSHAKESAAKADLVSIDVALNRFKADGGSFPTSGQGLDALIGMSIENNSDWTKTPTDPWGHKYIYRSPSSNGVAYELFCSGPDGMPGTADDIH